MSPDRSPRWLLIGASGLVGSHVHKALAGRDVVATVHHSSAPGALPLDITDPDATATFVRGARPDVVVVCAAAAFVERCEREPAATRAVNVAGLRSIADAAPGAVLVVFSSEYVFDSGPEPHREEDPVSPINEYGRQKVLVEGIARERDAHLVCRVSGVYGWSRARTSFVAQLVDHLRAGRRFAVPADQLITPTPAVDLGRAVVRLVELGVRGTVHVAGPEVLGRPEFARRAAAAFGLDAADLDAVPTERLALAAPRPLGVGLHTEKLAALLGHALPGSERGLAAMRDAEQR